MCKDSAPAPTSACEADEERQLSAVEIDEDERGDAEVPAVAVQPGVPVLGGGCQRRRAAVRSGWLLRCPADERAGPGPFVVPVLQRADVAVKHFEAVAANPVDQAGQLLARGLAVLADASHVWRVGASGTREPRRGQGVVAAALCRAALLAEGPRVLDARATAGEVRASGDEDEAEGR